MVGTHLLPPNLLKLFAPRAPLPYLKPTGRDPDLPLKSRARRPPRLAVAPTLTLIREERENKEAADAEAAGKAKVNEGDGEEGELASTEQQVTLCADEALKLRKEVKHKKHLELLDTMQKNYNPHEDEQVQGDPYKTLFVARLPYEMNETDILREFELYGPIERIHLARDKKGKSRGYCFLVYQRESDTKAAYKEAEGLKIMGRRLMVDIERGRTVKNWKPRRLGGGLGGRPKQIVAAPAASEPSFAPARRGGRGGFGSRGTGPGGFSERRPRFGNSQGGGGFQGGDRDRGYGGGRGGGGFGGNRGGFGGGNRGGFNAPVDSGYGKRPGDFGGGVFSSKAYGGSCKGIVCVIENKSLIQKQK